MKVILSEENIKEIQNAVSQGIIHEIENQLYKRNINSPYLNKKQTCDYLGISNNTLDKWIAKGLPIIRVGKVTRFDTQQIRQWMNNHILEN